MESWRSDVPDFHVGDTWRFVSFLLNRSVEIGEEVAGDVRSEKVKGLALEILAELDSPGRVQFVCGASGHVRSIWDMVSTVPTKVRWCGDKMVARFAYQFDGVSNSERKNPPEAEVHDFLEWAHWEGLEAVPLGKHLGISGSVRAAAGCSFFVGCCSGMAQLVYSVGLPAVILRYKQTRIELARWHRGKAVGIALGLLDFQQRFLPGLSCLGLDYGTVQKPCRATVV